MKYKVVVTISGEGLVAAVRTSVRIGDVASAWKLALDQVCDYLRTRKEMRPGHNLFLYHHPDSRDDAMIVDFGFQIASPIDRHGNVQCVVTPGGEVASTVHVGPYDRLAEAHSAIHAWCAADGRRIAQTSWETYGDWSTDPAMLETKIKYLLA